MQDGTKCQIVKVCHSTHSSALSDRRFTQSTPNLKLLWVYFIMTFLFTLKCYNRVNNKEG